ncbi:MAG: hypothetical protein M1839_009116 [Geoglossum umbratile]|nr:MAG: hypothetical protein M1839_009116 [Geoglossum umbratile]
MATSVRYPGSPRVLPDTGDGARNNSPPGKDSVGEAEVPPRTGEVRQQSGGVDGDVDVEAQDGRRTNGGICGRVAAFWSPENWEFVNGTHVLVAVVLLAVVLLGCCVYFGGMNRPFALRLREDGLTVGLAVSTRSGTGSGDAATVCPAEEECGPVGLGIVGRGVCDYVDEFVCVPGLEDESVA